MEDNMRMEVEFDWGQTRFKDLKIGEVFSYHEGYYMKVDESFYVDLESWESHLVCSSYEEDIIVQPKKSKLTILG